MKLLKMINEYLEHEAEVEGSRPNTPGIYRVSDISGCHRAVQYSMLKYKPAKIPANVLLIFKDGHLHHDAIRSLLSKVGTVTNVEMTISKGYKFAGQEFFLAGTIDGKFNGILFDAKSISTHRFRTIDRDFPFKYMNYVYQLNTYMDMDGQEKSFFLFKDKNTGELKPKYIRFQMSHLNTILGRAASVELAIKEGKLVPRPYGEDSWECKSCKFNVACYKDGDTLPRKARSGAQG